MKQFYYKKVYQKVYYKHDRKGKKIREVSANPFLTREEAGKALEEVGDIN